MSHPTPVHTGGVITCPLPLPGPVPQASLDGKLTESPDLPQSVEALVNDCFQVTMDAHGLTAERAEYAQKFEKFLTDCHSHENLAFLMEIYRYEYFYERLAPSVGSHDQVVSASLVDRSLEKFIDTLPDPTRSMGRHLRRSSVKSHSNVSLASSSGVPFALDFDEPADAWQRFSDQQISADSDSDAASESSVLRIDDDASVSPTVSEDSSRLLQEQWQHIFETFIAENAPCQINLSNKTYRALMETYALTGPHCPSVLLPAKSEIIRLIHENTYHPFTKAMRNCSCENSEASSLLGSPFSARETSPFPRKARDTPESSVPIPQSVPVEINLLESSHKTSIAVAPVPKKRSKFLSSLQSTSSSDTSSPSNTLNSFLTHLKPQSGPISRSYSSAPQSPAPATARNLSPFSNMFAEDVIPRPRSSAVPESQPSPSIFGKLWKKKR
ncbi:hypothetical protein OXX59_005587 [Metschnikowia pulcherrima]